MSLLDRLLGTEEPNLSIHAFMAAMAEYKRGAVTGQQVVDVFALSPQEATHLQEFLDNLDSDAINRAVIHDVLLLGGDGLYPKTMVKNRLGLTEG